VTPHSNSFQKALADAEKRLAKALNERAMAQETLNDLAVEIPSLQKTISALQYQLNPKTVMVLHKDLNEEREFLQPPPANAVLANEIDEDSLLPDVDGTPLIED
jgi:septal ring factor EnvC (AmiA/AmiB activator)